MPTFKGTLMCNAHKKSHDHAHSSAKGTAHSKRDKKRALDRRDGR